jgi:hypothetical protein
MFNGVGAQGTHAADESGMTIYVVPAISDEKILPTSTIPDSYISNEISIVACPGEYEPASFVIHALDDIASLEVEATDLEGEDGFIPSDNIDIRVVKCWYQAGEEINEPHYNEDAKVLTPELLLKDDSLVKVEDGENYLKLTTGEYLWISDPTPATDPQRPRTIEEIPVKDSPTLQPVNIPNGTNKQFWVTVKIPKQAMAGIYSGEIVLNTYGLEQAIQLNLEVLPIELSEPYLTYSLYYTSKINSVDWPQGSISGEWKSEDQLREELWDMFNHGVKNPNSSQYYREPDLARYLEIRNEVGMGGQPYYLHGGIYPSGYQPIDEVQQYMTFLANYGYTEVYFYGEDEAAGQALLDQRESWQAIKDAGGKMFASCHGDVFDLVGDLLDLAVYEGPPSTTEAAMWHSAGHQIFCYGNPQAGEEKPETYRRNYGLLLWQADYDGAMNFAYQWPRGNIWNDFDDERWRDHVFAYPTINGVIDTIQWEGWREGVDDVRYLTTLLALIEEAKESIDTSAAESWLAALKSSDLTQQNLDVVRSQIIGHIRYLHPPILYTIGDKTVFEGELLEFTISGIDPDGDPLIYSVNNLPPGASFVGQTFSWTPTGTQAGTYYLEFTVTDSSKPFLCASQSITVTVNDLYGVPWIWFVIAGFILFLVAVFVFLRLTRRWRA